MDALVGEQTREHSDLDAAVERKDVEGAAEALGGLGFRHDPSSEPGLPARFVLRDATGRQVDFHPLVFDDRGDGWQQLSDSGREWGRYPAAELTATGRIGDREVRCISPSLQGRFKGGHAWTGEDECDLRLLAERFDIPVPPPLRTS